MRLLLIAALLLVFAVASFSITPISATIGDFEFLYSEEALRFKPDHPEAGIVRTVHQNNLISMRIQELMLARVRLLGISNNGLLDEHQKEQTLYFTRWILQEDTEVLLSYPELYGERIRWDSDMNTIAYVWVPAEVDGEEVLLSLNYIMLLNGYAEFEEERYLSEEYETLFRSAHSYSKANHLCAWGDVILDNPPVVEKDTGLIDASTFWDPIVYVTRYGDKYHRYYCQHLRDSKLRTTLFQARTAGYEPCSVCNPPR